MIYLDHNASSPMLEKARHAWLDAVERFPGNPSSPHRIGARADAALNDARQRLASILDCHPLDIVWTSGATESANMVLHHFACTAKSGDEVWISAVEHPSILEPARHYFKNRLKFIPVDSQGIADLDWLKQNLARTRPAFVALMAANNETGVLQPWQTALDLCGEYRVPVICDAVQWIGKLPAGDLGKCGFVIGSAHKFGGPRGVGFLKCRTDGATQPLLMGGPQEEGRRGGTENVAGAVATAVALEEREKQLKAGNHKSHQNWKNHFETKIQDAIEGIKIVSVNSQRLWNATMVVMPESDCRHRWVVKLDKLGIAVSTGSACASGKEKSSHVLDAMGYLNQEVGRVLRFSAGWESSEADWQHLFDALCKLWTSSKQEGGL